MDYKLIYQYIPTYSKVLNIYPLLGFVLVAILLVAIIRKYYTQKTILRQPTLFFSIYY